MTLTHTLKISRDRKEKLLNILTYIQRLTFNDPITFLDHVNATT